MGAGDGSGRMTRSARLALAGFGAATALAALPAAAAAATTTSSNWAGYAVGPKSKTTRLARVYGSWVVPQGTCTPGSSGYSATWVGLGGFKRSSQSLEQAGTEFDCKPSGEPVYSAWYELVPAAGRTINMTVRPGDQIDAAVTVTGTHVTIALIDRTRGTTFEKTLTMRTPDVSSAEWIVEAPSECNSSGQCAQLPISNFGTVAFKNAYVMTARGRSVAAGSAALSRTKIELSQDYQRYRFAAESSAAGASPSDLSGDRRSFSVTYQEQTQPQSSRPRQFPGGPPPPY